MSGNVIWHRRHSPPPWKYEKIYTFSMDDSLEWVRWIERFVVGQTDPTKEPDPDQQNVEAYQIKEAFKMGAQLIGIEQGWRIRKCANNIEKTAQYTAYHMGFDLRPDHRKCKKALFSGEPNKVEKFVVGTTHFLRQRPEYEIENQIHRINRSLAYGRIVGLEKIYTIARRSSQERALCYPVYHLGFKHKLS